MTPSVETPTRIAKRTDLGGRLAPRQLGQESDYEQSDTPAELVPVLIPDEVNRRLWRYKNDTRFGGKDSTGTNPVDNYFFIDSSLRYSVLTSVTARIIYGFQDNGSNQSAIIFYDNRPGAD